MYERMDFCPKCNGIRKMVLSVGLKTIETADGQDEILVYHRHCASCNAYVRSITLEHEDIIIPSEMMVFSIPAFA